MRFPERIWKMNRTELDTIVGLPLTDDEREVVYSLCKGHNVQRIAYDMATSEKTIYRRIRTIKNKMGVDCNMPKLSSNSNAINVPVSEKILLTIPEASALSNIGQTKLNELVNDWRCNFVFKVGAKRLIKKKEFLQFISETDEV